MATPDGSATFTVLLVCTANWYRSPIAEHLLRDALTDRAVTWAVGSAGTQAREGSMLDLGVSGLLGLDTAQAESWRSRRLTPALIERADLVLTAEEEHRRAVVQLWPRSLRHTYTLLNFARFTALVPAGSMTSGSALVEAVNDARAHTQPAKAGADDIADPSRHLRRRLPTCVTQIRSAVSTIAASLAPIGDARAYDGRHTRLERSPVSSSRVSSSDESPAKDPPC